MAKQEKKPILKIVFRKFREGDVIALFCGSAPDARPGNVVCYQRIGQHGEASRDLGRNLPLATPEEYAPLLREIQGIYSEYQVIPVTRLYVGKYR